MPARTVAVGVLAHAQRHGGPAVEHVQHAAGVLRVAQAVVDQVPIQPVDAGVGMAGSAALPVLEADRGVVEQRLAAALLGPLRPGAQGDLRRRAGPTSTADRPPTGIAEVFGDEDVGADGRHAPGARAFQLDPPPQRPGTPGRWARRPARRETEPLVGPGRRLAGLVLRRGGFDLRQFFHQTGGIDHAQLVGAGVGNADLFAVAAGGHAPRVGRPQVHVVQQHRVDELLGRRVDDAQGVGVHPAPLQLRGGHLVAGQDVGHVHVLAVGRHAQPAHARAAVGQADGRGLPGGRVDHADGGRHVVAVRAVQRQVVGHEDRLAVGRDRRGDRLAYDRHSGDLRLPARSITATLLLKRLHT